MGGCSVSVGGVHSQRGCALGKPMLWRFFGVWGKCLRRGGVVIVNMDFQTVGAPAISATLPSLPSLPAGKPWCTHSPH